MSTIDIIIIIMYLLAIVVVGLLVQCLSLLVQSVGPELPLQV